MRALKETSTTSTIQKLKIKSPNRKSATSHKLTATPPVIFKWKKMHNNKTPNTKILIEAIPSNPQILFTYNKLDNLANPKRIFRPIKYQFTMNLQ